MTFYRFFYGQDCKWKSSNLKTKIVLKELLSIIDIDVKKKQRFALHHKKETRLSVIK